MTREHLDLDVKFTATRDDQGTFEGHAAIFNNVDRVGDQIVRGAFAKSLAEHAAAGTKPALLWAHNPAEPVGIILEIREDDAGLFLKGQLADTTRGREARELMRLGALAMSIGYRTRAADKRPGGGRTLKEIDVVECSLVSIPANPSARIAAVKSAENAAAATTIANAINRAAAALKLR